MSANIESKLIHLYGKDIIDQLSKTNKQDQLEELNRRTQEIWDEVTETIETFCTRSEKDVEGSDWVGRSDEQESWMHLSLKDIWKSRDQLDDRLLESVRSCCTNVVAISSSWVRDSLAIRSSVHYLLTFQSLVEHLHSLIHETHLEGKIKARGSILPSGVYNGIVRYYQCRMMGGYTSPRRSSEMIGMQVKMRLLAEGKNVTDLDTLPIGYKMMSTSFYNVRPCGRVSRSFVDLCFT